MTLKQKIVVLAGTVLVGLAVLFPPSTTAQSSQSVTKRFLGIDFTSGVTTVNTEFSFLDYENASYGMLASELVIIGLTAGVLIYAFRPRPRQK